MKIIKRNKREKTHKGHPPGGQSAPLKGAAHSMRHSPPHSAQLFPQDHCHRQEHRVDDLQLEALDL